MPNPLPPGIRPAFPRRIPTFGIRTQFLELLGLDRLPDAVDATVEAAAEDGAVRELRLSYVNSLGETLTAIALVPLDPPGGRVPGVVCMHGTGGTMANVLAPKLEVDPDSGQLLGWGRELANRGYATMSISLKGSVVRRGSAEAWEHEARLLEAYGRPHGGIVVEEALLAARALAALPGVDGSRIGLTGMSLGGLATWTAMACDPWIRAGAAVCGVLGSLSRLIHEGNTWRHSSLIFVPHLLRCFDHGDIVSCCIAPRPFMAIAPLEDIDMPRTAVDELVRMVTTAYFGAEERFLVHRPPGGHSFTPEYFEWVAAWFDRFLMQ